MEQRRATFEDLSGILQLVKEAKAFLKVQGIDQWQEGYPDLEIIKKDLSENESWVFEEGEELFGYLTVVPHSEEIYTALREGRWLNQNGTEGAMHHVMISDRARGKGLSGKLFAVGINRCRELGKESIRMDTHPDNLLMQHLIEKHGFLRCGSLGTKEERNQRFVYEQIMVRVSKLGT